MIASTSALCGSLKSQVDKLKLVDLVRKLEDEDLVEREPLRGTPWMAEELDEGISQLVP